MAQRASGGTRRCHRSSYHPGKGLGTPARPARASDRRGRASRRDGPLTASPAWRQREGGLWKRWSGGGGLGGLAGPGKAAGRAQKVMGPPSLPAPLSVGRNIGPKTRCPSSGGSEIDRSPCGVRSPSSRVPRLAALLPVSGPHRMPRSPFGPPDFLSQDRHPKMSNVPDSCLGKWVRPESLALLPRRSPFHRVGPDFPCGSSCLLLWPLPRWTPSVSGGGPPTGGGPFL